MTKGTALLIVGHPGHELMIHGWLESATPLVLVLTDGSGHAGVPRLASTAALLRGAGATAGSVFGRFTDVALYRAILDHNETVFADLVEEMADVIVDRHISVVVGDDAEGFNPTHDVCRLLIDAAVRRARVLSGRPVANFAFKL